MKCTKVNVQWCHRPISFYLNILRHFILFFSLFNTQGMYEQPEPTLIIFFLGQDNHNDKNGFKMSRFLSVDLYVDLTPRFVTFVTLKIETSNLT
jgi:hypothetical protein